MKHRIALAGIVLLAGIINCVGIDWGLPSREHDRYLFGDAGPWSGERIAALGGAEERRHLQRGADVDVNPRTRSGERINSTDAEQAEIYRRYRLFTRHPDEMVTLMAIASMHPSQYDFDPKLYQYGGLFVYPVAAMLKAASVIGVIDLRTDITWYLDHPEAFGRFYVVMRLYVVAFALAGVVGVYLLTTRLANRTAGLVASLLFVLMPITINGAHEAKPHLPAAVLMTFALLSALRYMDRPSTRSLMLLGAMCGLSFGMVLSGWVVFLVLPTVAWLRHERWAERVSIVAAGGGVGVLVYALTNPYVVINALTNRSLLAENLSNTAAMFGLADPGLGLFRTASVVAEGMSPLLATAAIAAVVIMVASRQWRATTVALVPTLAVLLNMVLVGAGKPGEFGRFALFADTVLVVMVAAAGVQLWWRAKQIVVAGLVVCAVGVMADGLRYERGFIRESLGYHTRAAAAAWLAQYLEAGGPTSIGVLADPAPYLTPPLDFAACDVIAIPRAKPDTPPATLPGLLIYTGDYSAPPLGTWWERLYRPVRRFPATPPRFWTRPTTISWADKPVTVYRLAILDNLALPR